MIRNYSLTPCFIISHFYMGTILTDDFKTIFLRCFIISLGVNGIFYHSFPYHSYIVTRNNTYVNIKKHVLIRVFCIGK